MGPSIEDISIFCDFLTPPSPNNRNFLPCICQENSLNCLPICPLKLSLFDALWRKSLSEDAIEMYNNKDSDIEQLKWYHIQEAWHSFIDAKCRPWSHKSDANPPEGDTKPPGVDKP